MEADEFGLDDTWVRDCRAYPNNMIQLPLDAQNAIQDLVMWRTCNPTPVAMMDITQVVWRIPQAGALLQTSPRYHD
eukprot:CAMPEP_0114124566 /NCGR_PEP_ID=MMETSP0043_2-20121206/8846_1 /TAXON_ID=464988 /ORGANISM="Hemiselmis andersenii, Strain CCMP644" /LENGTH=75 /DNA_ID=CAMNT_0001217455 /DNA_START=1 /DNA_END=228 /DNA_ORIENTATION=-